MQLTYLNDPFEQKVYFVNRIRAAYLLKAARSRPGGRKNVIKVQGGWLIKDVFVYLVRDEL